MNEVRHYGPFDGASLRRMYALDFTDRSKAPAIGEHVKLSGCGCYRADGRLWCEHVVVAVLEGGAQNVFTVITEVVP